jgi:hypothetical protein
MTMNNKFAAMSVVDDEDVPMVVAKKQAPKKSEAPKKKVVKLGGAMNDDGFEAIGAPKF